ncbi:transposase IS66 [Caballeronia hypogeia]|uniref:Transposase IS66 n=1 Tax=Caballeronia hypogeia TaxID=1777140 RepID=A0A158CC88_9BURK|nr:transposase IS66 [Caballeronia hypogeia]
MRSSPNRESLRIASATRKAFFDSDGLRITSGCALLRQCNYVHCRKNYLFVGSDSGGERAAAMYSLIGTCKLNEINPRAYLEYVLTNIADHKVNRVDELLPWNVADKLKPAAAPTPTV